MSLQIVIGAGPVGTETARLLGREGHEVIITSRSVGNLDIEGARTVQADATDAGQLARICSGADTIFMCAMAAYDRWPTHFFPIMDGVVRAAEAVGAKLVVLGNVYGYGEGAASPLTPDLPLNPTSKKGTARTIMWQRALLSNVPAIEVRASDYLGFGATTYFSLLALPSILEGKPVQFLGDLNARHAWSFTKDVAKTLVAASAYPGEWGRVFHVPSQHLSPRDLFLRAAAMVGSHVSPQMRTYSIAEMELFGMRELAEMRYLFEQPLLVDASETERLLGVYPASIETMLADTLSI